MPRPRRARWIGFQPSTTYFKPAGVRIVDLEETTLNMDEFEAIRLKDLEGLDQEECAKQMNISQPTFHRLIISARRKIAESLVKGKAIKIEGGEFKMAPQYNQRGRGYGRRGEGPGAGPIGDCLCPNCEHREPHQRGIPCYTRKCPKCGAPMTRA